MTYKGIGEYRAITLTTAIETINVNKVDATIVGYATTGTAAGDTFQAGDTLNGLANGNTTIQLTAAGTIAANPAITNVATLNVRAAATSTMAANAGYSTITSTNSNAEMAFTAIAKSATLGFGGYGAAVGGNDVSFTYAANALGSAAASQALVLNGVGTATSRPVVQIATDGNDVIKTINVVATGTNGIATENTAGNTNAWVAATTLNIAGAGSFRLDGGSNTLANVTTVNASTNTGGVTVDLATGGNAANVNFTGGSGNDKVSFAANNFNINDVINMGTGAYDILALGDATITTAGTPNLVTAIKAVVGLDALELTYAGATGTLSFNANNIGLSNYIVSGASTGAAGATGAPGATGSSAVSIAGELNTQSFFFTASQTAGAGGAGAASNNSGGVGGSAVAVAANLDNGTNVLSVTLGDLVAGTGVTFTGGVGGASHANGNGVGGAGGVGFDATNFETVNIVTQGGASTFVGGSGGASTTTAGAAAAGLVVSTNATVNVSGSQALTLGPVSGTNVSIIADSAYAKALSVATLSGNTTVTSGAGNDTITLVAAATGTVNTGAGNDTVVLVGAANYVSKTNTIDGAGVTMVAQGNAGHGDIITLGAGTDTVKFTASNLANMNAISAGTTRGVWVKDFVVGADKFAMVETGGAATSIAFGAASTVATADTLAQIYAGITAIGASTNGGALSASLVTVSAGAKAGTYLYINDDTATVNNTDDMLVNITGITGTLSSSDFVFA